MSSLDTAIEHEVHRQLRAAAIRASRARSMALRDWLPSAPRPTC